MNGKQFAEYAGLAHGTVKRWLHEGMPARRCGHEVRINQAEALAWIASRYGKTIAFDRQSVIYFAEREDGAVKIGWSSDVMRRVQELRKKSRAAVELLACYPGTKQDEAALHERFRADHIDGEWFRRSSTIDDFLRSLGRSEA